MPDAVANANAGRFLLARHSYPYLGPRAEIERLLSTEIPVVHAPQFRVIRLDCEIQPIGVGQFIGLVPGFGVGDLDMIQCHDGASSNGALRHHQKHHHSDVLPMDTGG